MVLLFNVYKIRWFIFFDTSKLVRDDATTTTMKDHFDQQYLMLLLQLIGTTLASLQYGHIVFIDALVPTTSSAGPRYGGMLCDSVDFRRDSVENRRCGSFFMLLVLLTPQFGQRS